jgi:D-glycero-D-manno-heptose 1,7-bisphosphate phosphatase
LIVAGDGGRRRAVFLDRDGVLNRNVWYLDTEAWESPRTAEELQLVDGVGPALRELREAGFALVLVSNQPNAAKGKVSARELERIHGRLVELLAHEGVRLDEFLYCLHHPDFTGTCVCRKPSPFFLLEMIRRWALNARECWMVGDRETDVECGRRAGVKTVWVDTGEGNRRPEEADLVAGSLAEALESMMPATVRD